MDATIRKALYIDESVLGTVDDYEHAFARVGDFLLNRVDLIVGGKVSYRIAELEFYFTSERHNDVFCHQNQAQKQFCTWYFHRSGQTYKGGTYKGLDVAIGNDDVFAGVLIRALETESGDVIEGSCLCVNDILKSAGVDSVAELADGLLGPSRLGAASSDASHPLRLALSATPRTRTVARSMRVGLTLKQKTDGEARLRFIGAPYRFVTRHDVIRKGAPQLVAALAFAGHDVAEIASMLKMKPATVAAHVDAYKAGLSKKLVGLVGATLKPADYADLFARWVTHHGRKSK